MTTMEVTFRFANALSEAAARAIDNLREVYGIRKISVNEKERTIRVEYDASRLKVPAVMNLLRRAGLALGERLIPA